MHIWLLDNGTAGFRAHTAGLTDALARRLPDLTREVPPLPPRTWLAGLAPRFAAARCDLKDMLRAANSAPDLVVASGRASVVPALACKRQLDACVVYIERPPVPPDCFDAVICAHHDHLSGDQVLPITGAIGTVRPDLLQARSAAAKERFATIPAPRTALLLGGDNRAFSLTAELCRQLAKQLHRALAQRGGGLLVTASRRTDPAATRALTEALEQFGVPTFCYSGGGDNPADNPYEDMLAAADEFMVTADSVNMLSETCATGKPVYIVPLRTKKWPRGLGKFQHFHEQLQQGGHARLWRGDFESWQAVPLAEAERAADFVLARYALKAPSGAQPDRA